jgi:tetratricopeptide (TPR) repeat protein
MADPAAFLDLLARAELRSAAGDWAEAAGLWDQVTAANPVHGDYWARLAEARFAEQDYAAADLAYTKVLELGVRPEYRVRFQADADDFLPGEAAYLIACCQARLGRHAEAIDALAMALGRGFRDLDRARTDECWQAWRDDERLRDLLGIVETEGLSRDEGWRTDLRLLARELKRRAYAPFALISEEEFDREVARLDDSIPGLTDTQVIVAMTRLTAHIDDGHAGIRMPDGDDELSRLVQLEFFLFAEGLFVTAAAPGYFCLLGAEVETIGDHPAEPFAAFCDRLFAFIAERRPGRLVIDLRWNGGGNTFLSQSLLHHLIRYPRISRRGALFVIIGRLTFSAAQNTATAIGRELEPTFVGEPTGSRPNFNGERIPFELPYSKLIANVGDLFWQTSWPEDNRTWIAPDIYAPPTFEAFRRNDDPALDAILALREHLPGR